MIKKLHFIVKRQLVAIKKKIITQFACFYPMSFCLVAKKAIVNKASQKMIETTQTRPNS